MIAITRSSSWTRVEGSSPATILQNRQSSTAVFQHKAYPPGVADVPDVTVSIVSSGDLGLLAACLDSIPAAAGRHDVETIVVDNAVGIAGARSPASHPGVARDRGRPAARVRRQPQPRLRRAPRGRYVFILNDDTVLDPGCIDRLRRFLDQNARRGRGRAAPAPRRRPRAAVGVPLPHAGAGGARRRSRCSGRAGSMSGGERIRRVDWIHGAAMMVRRDALARRRRARRGLLHVPRGRRPVPAAARPRLGDRVLPPRRARPPRELLDRRRARAGASTSTRAAAASTPASTTAARASGPCRR